MIKIINFITLMRIFLSVIIFFLISYSKNFSLALFLFFLAGISDYFDGYLARKYKSESELGEILDPVADKILIVFLFIGLSVSLDSFFIGIVSAFIISREIWVGALRDYNARKEKSNKTSVTFLAKIKTAIQFVTITIYLVGLSLNNMLILVIGDVFLLIALLVTIYTGYIYTVNSFSK